MAEKSKKGGTKKTTAPKASKAKSKPTVKAPASSKSRLTKEERNWGMFCHLGAFAGFIIPFGNIIAPLILWLLKREDSSFIDAQGKESLNFQVSFTIYAFVSLLLIFVYIGLIIFPILFFLFFILVIIAAIKAQDGVVYHYPLSIRLF